MKDTITTIPILLAILPIIYLVIFTALSELLPVLNVRKFETFIGLFQLQNKFLAEYSLWVKDCCSSVCPTLAPEAGPVNKLQMD